MRTWTATTTAEAGPEAVLGILTDPDAAGSDPAHPPVPFDVDDLVGERLLAGSRARVSGRLAGRLLAEATGALLTAGALQAALGRIAREASLALS